MFLFFLTFGVLCIAEWIAFWYVTGNPMGRIGVIQNSHLVSAGLEISFTDYLLNFTKLVKLKGLVAIWAVCLIAALHNVLTGSDRGAPWPCSTSSTPCCSSTWSPASRRSSWPCPWAPGSGA